MIRRLVLEDDTDQFHPIPFRACDQGLSGFIGIAGLAAYDSVIFNISVDQAVPAVEPEIIRLGVCRHKMVGDSTGNIAQIIIAEIGSGDLRHIIRTDIMVGIKKTVGVDKMGIPAAQFRGPLIHQIREITLGSGNLFRQSVGHFIGGGDHQSVQGLLDRYGFTHIHTDIGAVPGNAVDSLLRKGNRICQVQIFIGDQSGQKFGDAGRIVSFMDVFTVQDGAGFRFDQDSPLG